MKIRIDLDENAEEEEIIIRCRRLDESVRRIQQYIMDMPSNIPAVVYYKDTQEYYFPIEKVMFFETDADTVYAHTAEEAYRVRFRLYELENFLPEDFVRISKSTILNIRHVYSVDRNIASASLIKFYESHKQVFVSRFYYKNLSQKLAERRRV